MKNPLDENPMHHFSERDMKFFKKLFDEKYNLIYSFILGWVKQEWLAKDITQDVFMKLWENKEKINPSLSVHNYLFVLAKSEMRDHFRLKCNQKHQEVQEEDRIYSEDFEGSMDAQMMKIKLSKIIDQMPKQRQKIYRLSRENQFSNKEIAKKLNLSSRTVERHIRLALNDIKTNLPLILMIIVLIFFK